MLSEYPIFMETVPAFQIRGEHMHVTWPTLEIVVPIATALAGIAAARAEIERWSQRSARVLAIR